MLFTLFMFQVSDCNLGVDLYAAGGWTGLSDSDRVTVLNYGNAFRDQLQPLMDTDVNHGGFIVPCLVHCVTGFGFWSQGNVRGTGLNAAFYKWYEFVGAFALLAQLCYQTF
jgi:hypothetical protein